MILKAQTIRVSAKKSFLMVLKYIKKYSVSIARAIVKILAVFQL